MKSTVKMRRWCRVLACPGLFIGALVIAVPQAEACRSVLAVFAEVHEKLYCPGGCFDHVYRVLQIVDRRWPTARRWREGNVLLLTPHGGEDVLYPRPGATRIFPKEGWRNHVVLELDGLIYDADLPQAEPVPIADYFKGVFGANAPMDVRPVAASSFLRGNPPPPVSADPGSRVGLELEHWREERAEYENWFRGSRQTPERPLSLYLQERGAATGE